MANPNNPLAPGLNGAAPKGPRTIWNNPVFSAVLAIIMGFAMWIIVTVYIDPQGSTTVTGVPINYTSGASTYTAQGLDIVEKPDIEGVTVKVEGNSTIIGNIRSADIMVYPKLRRCQRRGQGHAAPAGPCDEHNRLPRRH